jgi:hypothetical protein
MKAAKKKTRIFLPPNALEALLSRPGGKTRDEAIDDALAGIETLRDISIEVIERAIEAIEVAARQGGQDTLNADELEHVAHNADIVISLAGTYGFANLDTAGRSLCDLIRALLKIAPCPAEPVVVHARALNLFAPGKPAMNDEEARTVLAELAKFLAYFDAKPAAPDVSQPTKCFIG